MHRIFGFGKKEAPAPSLDDISQRMGNRAELIDKKIQKLDAELLKIKDQIKKTKSKPVQDRLKQRALQLLKQKKMYSSQQDNLYQQQFNVDQTMFTTNTLKENIETVGAMQQAAKEMKKQYKNIDVDKVERMQDEMFDLMADANEIQDVLSRSYETPEYIDEDDVMDELNALEADMGQEESIGDYLDAELPAAPAKPAPLVADKKPVRQVEADPETRQLERELGLL